MDEKQQAKTFDITVSVPRVGRVFENFMRRIAAIGAPQSEIETLVAICHESKARSSPDFATAATYLTEATSRLPCFGLFVDKRRSSRPFRVGLLNYTTTIQDLCIKIEGDEPHNSASLLRFSETDLAVVGFDELLVVTQASLRQPIHRTKWGMFNKGLPSFATRIAGSARLTTYNPVLREQVQDFVGFFLISKQREPFRTKQLNNVYPKEFLLERFDTADPIFVKARYLGIIEGAYPSLNLVPVEDVEDAILNAPPGRLGLEIIQSGQTVAKKDLAVHGAPLFLSESLYVANYDKYVTNGALRKFLGLLAPQAYFAEDRLLNFAKWYRAIELTLADRWIQKPTVEDMFCEPGDFELGLSPYRLETRGWEAPNGIKSGQARVIVNTAMKGLHDYYEGQAHSVLQPMSVGSLMSERL
jgi:hypothetical protein